MAYVARPIGELDLYLFGEGTHRRLWELLGPQPLRIDGAGSALGARFSLWAPTAASVAVVGEWNDGVSEPLDPIDTDVRTGLWSGVAPAARSGHRYGYEVTGGDGVVVHTTDPMARHIDRASNAASVVPAATDHGWADADWMRERGRWQADEASIRVYDLDRRSREIDTWERLAEDLVDVPPGITHVAVPVAVPAAADGRGDRVVAPFAPTPRLGEPDGVRRFVDRLHQRGLGVVVDWEPASFGRDEWCRGDGAPGDQVESAPDVDLDRREVRNVLVANALYWLDEFHADGLRIGSGWTPALDGPGEHRASAFLQELRAIVGEEFPDALLLTGPPADPGA